mgnify:CR=1 FL=1|tara:strand:- start:9464 stop:10573 length:1110 start_codon:yes stop_codon:yes gene_type:complete
MTKTHNTPILILGGGLIGLSIAYELSRKGEKVKVLSRSRKEAAGFVAAGMLAPHAEGLEDEMLKLGQESLKEIPLWVKNIEADSGMKCGLRQSGIIVPFHSDDEIDKYPTSKFGKYLSHQEIKNEIPNLEDSWKTGILFPLDGQIDNRRQLMRALEKACFSKGVQFEEGIEVKEILQESQYFYGVKIKNCFGEIKNIFSNKAILCCGAWSKQVFHEIPIYPVKGQMLSIQGPKNALKRILFRQRTYLVPREDGLIVIGATIENDAGFAIGNTPAGQKELLEGIRNLLPEANRWPHMEHWWGFRPTTPDKMPLLGESSLKNLFLATGHYRNGVLLAAKTSQLILKLIQGLELNNLDKQFLKNFSVKRFEN